jgi:hypothetical protein
MFLRTAKLAENMGFTGRITKNEILVAKKFSNVVCGCLYRH